MLGLTCSLNGGLEPKGRADPPARLRFEMPVVDPTRKHLQGLANLSLPPQGQSRCCLFQLPQKPLDQILDRALPLLSADSGQKILDMNAPPVEFILTDRNLLLLPKPLQPSGLWRKRTMTTTAELIPCIPHKLRGAWPCGNLESSMPSRCYLNIKANGPAKHSSGKT